uniref:AAA+ ATPase domain-containing protein n=1 Tax=Heterosigma akashiwo TaxID=2829 RepID=A0A6V1PIA9_HETAK|mmetsp:Transcript_39645/g.70814  ORF Transcript_39645/g.70814 Transcript_39645/m.70814 type:complete len:409 (+) Transcript_39645:54-1280(+)
MEELGILIPDIPTPSNKSMEVEQPAASSTDLYVKLKSFQKHIEFLDIQEEYIKDEMKNLKRELIRAKEEIKRIQSVPLVIGQFNEMLDANYGIVGSTAGSSYMVRILSTLDREALKPNTSVALHRHSHAVVEVLPPESDSTIQLMAEKPDVTYQQVGGLDMQKQELREAVELPLTHFQLYKQIGIDPPRGVLLYGPPGTGKTMIAKAVANSTTAAFISMVGSEFVQKYLGEGPRMVRDVFRLARENAPAIVFIDEIDAIATKRFDAQTGADREVQRILLELLNQMDGFDQATNVKVIMCTNRPDTLDPALLRPGRLDRKIEFPEPDRRQKRLVFQAATAKMNLSEDLDLEDYVNRPEKISSADVAAICQEAGLQAVRQNRYVILGKDFDEAYKKHVNKADKEHAFYSM